jgi:hypothetical protein
MIQGLEVKKFEKGICFICGQPCREDIYVHLECATAYTDEKQKRIKEADEAYAIKKKWVVKPNA